MCFRYYPVALTAHSAQRIAAPSVGGGANGTLANGTLESGSFGVYGRHAANSIGSARKAGNSIGMADANGAAVQPHSFGLQPVVRPAGATRRAVHSISMSESELGGAHLHPWAPTTRDAAEDPNDFVSTNEDGLHANPMVELASMDAAGGVGVERMRRREWSAADTPNNGHHGSVVNGRPSLTASVAPPVPLRAHPLPAARRSVAAPGAAAVAPAAAAGSAVPGSGLAVHDVSVGVVSSPDPLSLGDDPSDASLQPWLAGGAAHTESDEAASHAGHTMLDQQHVESDW